MVGGPSGQSLEGDTSVGGGRPYTLEQNGIIERFSRSLKEECVWQQTFQTFEEARRFVRDWAH